MGDWKGPIPTHPRHKVRLFPATPGEGLSSQGPAATDRDSAQDPVGIQDPVLVRVAVIRGWGSALVYECASTLGPCDCASSSLGQGVGLQMMIPVMGYEDE